MFFFCFFAKMATLLLKTLDGRMQELKGINLETDTFEHVAKKVEEKVGITPTKQRLVFNGKICALNARLSDLGIKEKDTLQLVLQLK